MDQNYLTLAEVSQLLGVSMKKISEAFSKKNLCVQKVILKNDLRRFLLENEI